MMYVVSIYPYRLTDRTCSVCYVLVGTLMTELLKLPHLSAIDQAQTREPCTQRHLAAVPDAAAGVTHSVGCRRY
jgi:hypothetical protein